MSQGPPIPPYPPKEGTSCPSSIASGCLGSSPSSTTNPNSPTGIHLWLYQVPIIPSHNPPPLFKKLFKTLPSWNFGVPWGPGQKDAYLGVMGASPLRLV